MLMKILFVSLGCDKNLVDTEVMLGLLRERGYEFTDEEAEADIVVVNTCCFIGDAKEESINTLLDMAELRKEKKIRALVAAGCLAERYREEIQKEIPEVDAVIGTMAIDRIVTTLEDVLKGEYIGCHPCVCTSSLKIKKDDVIEKFLPAVGHVPEVVRLTGEE